MPSDKKITDQTDYSFKLKRTPTRIISPVPSQTELLNYLGLEKEVVGITKFCIHPDEWFRSKARVGGTKQVKHDKIRDLQPDLIIANKEENSRPDILKLREKYPVYTSDIYNLEDNLDMIRDIASIIDKPDHADVLCGQIQHGLRLMRPLPSPLSVLYLIWDDPIMTVGTNTYINDMLERCGFVNALPKKLETTRYPAITIEDIQAINPDVLMLSSEPFPYDEQHIAKYKEIVPDSNVILVDGEMFSWYGSRSLLASGYFQDLILQLE